MSNELAVPNNGNLSLTDFVNASGVDEIMKPNCKLCNSKFRKDAEGMAERGQNISTIFRFLEREGEGISYNAINNHITYHFKVKQSDAELKEYAGQLEQWARMSQSDEALITKYVRMLDREITLLGAKNATADAAELRKNNEIILKMQAQVMSLKESSKKLNAEMQPIEILFASLDKIIRAKLTSGISPEAKRALQDVIDQLRKEVGEVPIEGSKVDE